MTGIPIYDRAPMHEIPQQKPRRPFLSRPQIIAICLLLLAAPVFVVVPDMFDSPIPNFSTTMLNFTQSAAELLHRTAGQIKPVIGTDVKSSQTTPTIPPTPESSTTATQVPAPQVATTAQHTVPPLQPSEPPPAAPPPAEPPTGSDPLLAGCPQSAGKVVMVAAESGSGSRGLTALLMKMGVFVTTGKPGTCPIPERADKSAQPSREMLLGCSVIRNDADDTDCSDNHLDFKIVDKHHSPTYHSIYSMTAAAHSMCFDRATDEQAFAAAEADLQNGITWIRERMKQCSEQRILARCPAAVGWKQDINLGLVPLLAALAEGAEGDRFLVLHLVRDGRDMALSRHDNSQENFGGLGGSRAALWAAINTGAKACAERLFGPSRYMSVRIEDLVFASTRSEQVSRIAKFLGIELPSGEALSEIYAALDTAVGEHAFDASAVYGKWKHSLDAGQLSEVEAEAAEGLKEFGYKTT